MYATHLLNVLYLMVNYENTLKGFRVMGHTTMGGNSKTDSAGVVSLARDTPTGRPLYPY